MKKLLTLASFALLLGGCSTALRADKIAIIPQPVQMTVSAEKGDFILNSHTSVTYPEGDVQLEKAANFIAKTLSNKIGTANIIATTAQTPGAIELKRWSDDPKAEGYKLEVSSDNIEIEAADYSGAVYAMQTLLQLMPTEVFTRDSGAMSSKIAIPAVEITDYPRFGWRGMHLDVSRHFFDANDVKKYIDYLAMHKMNRFHWHFTDDQGWRMESKKYPLLTEKAAWRVDRNKDAWDARKPIDRAAGEEATYGGFYTQDQIRDVVAYAAERGVVVIPEIEVPGHSSEVFAAYPNLSCLGVQQEVTPGGHYPTDMATCFCAGNEDVFVFLEGIMDEVVELFPEAPYIHIGGDEVDKRFWKNCPKCQERMRAEGLKNVDELQSYFIKRIEKYLNDKGKPIIGWDEILEGGLAPNATVMSWRGIAGGIEAARAGHDVVMTPNSHLYFDYYQSTPETEPVAPGGYNTTKRVYDYEPIPDALTTEEAKHILGAQANLWNEHVQKFSHVEYMVLPRMSALAEVVWSPKDSRDWDGFSERLYTHNQRFAAMGANFHPGNDQIEFSTAYDSITKTFYVTLKSELYNSDIYYTVDNTDPTMQSTKYSEPIPLDKTTNIKAVVAMDGKVLSKKSTERMVGMHKAVGKKILYNTKPSDAYRGSKGDATLNDGFTGSVNHNDGYMQGFNNHDFDVVIDLGEIMSFAEVTGSFLQSAGTWIYLPRELVVEVSDDNVAFTPAGSVTQDLDPKTAPNMRHAMTVKGDFKGRYVHIKGVNGITPAGLPGAGTVNWIFADEIFIN